MLEAVVNELEPRIPILEQQAEDLTPLVDMAKEHADNLTKQAEYLDRSVLWGNCTPNQKWACLSTLFWKIWSPEMVFE